MARLGVGRIDVLKIDVEGAEAAVLQPLFAECPQTAWPRLILTEVGRECATLTDEPHGRLLERAGYRLRRRTRLNAICELPVAK